MINVTKSTAPRTVFRYNEADIVAQIKDDFQEMCFLCEEVALRHSEVEHFYPVNGGWADREHDWDNLFWICGKCNKIKSDSYNRKNDKSTVENQILNNLSDDVENILQLSLNIPQTSINITIYTTDSVLLQKATTTKVLLNKIYNGIDTTSPSYIDLQKMIVTEMAKFRSLLREYDNQKKPVWYRQLQEIEIAKRLSKRTKTSESSFVGFKRYIIRNNPKYKEFEKYFD